MFSKDGRYAPSHPTGPCSGHPLHHCPTERGLLLFPHVDSGQAPWLKGQTVCHRSEVCQALNWPPGMLVLACPSGKPTATLGEDLKRIPPH